MKLRGKLVNLGVAAGSLLVAFLVAEATTRLVGCAQDVDFSLYAVELENPNRLPKGLYEEFPGTGVRLRPNHTVLATTSDFSVQYRVNSLGLRDRDYEPVKTPGTTRILALGDSLTFGEGVAYGNRYADLPEEELGGLEILNAGVPGWGLDQELIYLAHHGVGLRPDYVFFFISNIQVRRYNLALIKRGRVRLPEPVLQGASDAPQLGAQYVKRRPSGAPALLGYSHLVSYLYYRVQVTALKQRFEQEDRRIWGGITRGAAARGDRDKRQGKSVRHFYEQRALLLLAAARDLGRRYGFRVVVINVDIYPLPYLADLVPGIAHHDFAPALAISRKHRNISFKYDLHYNPETHAELGQELVKVICEGTPGLTCFGGNVRPTNTAVPTGEQVAAADFLSPPPAEPLPAQRAQSMVRHAYSGMLGRGPSAKELAWVDRLTARRAAAGEMVAEILALEEYRNKWRSQRWVAILYLGVLGRPPDPNGFGYYVKLLNDGATPERLLTEWSAGEEWKNNFGGLDDRQWVELLSDRMLGRSVSEEDLQLWTARASLGAQARRRLIIDTFAGSTEAERALAPDLLPILLTVGLRGDLLHESEYKVYSGRLNLGEPPARVFVDFLAASVPE